MLGPISSICAYGQKNCIGSAHGECSEEAAMSLLSPASLSYFECHPLLLVERHPLLLVERVRLALVKLAHVKLEIGVSD